MSKVDKKHILNEIKRTAAKNNGIPLGHRKFFTETGIKEADWKGKLWARWGDAVREAGFEANQKNEAYQDIYLIEKLASLVSEMDKFPVNSEIRLKSRADASFPNEKTLRRLGTKHQIATRILEYCQDRPEYQRVGAICRTIIEMRSAVLEEEAESEEIFGFVYLIRSGRNYKIGRSNSVGRRERELAIQLPEKIDVVHSIRTDDPAGIETYWHKRFEEKRKNGEWFELTSVDIKAFKRRKFM